MSVKKIHFLGIGGSGASACALIAKDKGYLVEGSDAQKSTPYIKALLKNNIQVFPTHDPERLDHVDAIAISPAMMFSKDIKMLDEAYKRNMPVMTWQEFMGKYLQKNMKVISIAGTHGKSTTTAMASLLFERGGLDPTVMIGAKVPEWNSNFRTGDSSIFICESDEFYNNFLNYSPETIILNNIEFDHPDFFTDIEDVYDSFRKFVLRLKNKKNLIVNQDDGGIGRLFSKMSPEFLNKFNIYGYSLGEPKFITPQTLMVKVLTKTTGGFKVEAHIAKQIYKYELNVPGEYNVSNSLGVALLSQLYGVRLADFSKYISLYRGIGRRMELKFKSKKVKIYDDYAHHTTKVKKTLLGLRQLYPNKFIIAIIEPHSYSRTKALLSEYKGIFDSADEVLIMPIFKSRDLTNFDVDQKDIVEMADHKNIFAISSYSKALGEVKKHLGKNPVVIVMGAGDSYKLTEFLCSALANENSK